ncbi:MAG: hypothetical protein IPM53_13020 [Anaerolineaceae bacterium]|nr:hypothetical protein [Anaerolineaceae bacterium]
MSFEFKGTLVTRDAVLRALRKFEQDYPDTNDYDSWLEKKNYQYAVQFNGRLFPPKYILSEVSGTSTKEFTGGEQTNRVFRALGFEVVSK